MRFDQFGHNASRPTGYGITCLECARANTRAWKKRKAATTTGGCEGGGWRSAMVAGASCDLIRLGTTPAVRPVMVSPAWNAREPIPARGRSEKQPPQREAAKEGGGDLLWLRVRHAI